MTTTGTFFFSILSLLLRKSTKNFSPVAGFVILIVIYLRARGEDESKKAEKLRGYYINGPIDKYDLFQVRYSVHFYFYSVPEFASERKGTWAEAAQ